MAAFVTTTLSSPNASMHVLHLPRHRCSPPPAPDRKRRYPLHAPSRRRRLGPPHLDGPVRARRDELLLLVMVCSPEDGLVVCSERRAREGGALWTASRCVSCRARARSGPPARCKEKEGREQQQRARRGWTHRLQVPAPNLALLVPTEDCLLPRAETALRAVARVLVAREGLDDGPSREVEQPVGAVEGRDEEERRVEGEREGGDGFWWAVGGRQSSSEAL